jgi:hypothetical protein
VQDERELVEHQGGAQAEQGGRAGPPAQRVQRRGKFRDAADAHEDHPEHHVVNVHIAGHDIARPPADPGPDEPGRKPDEAEAEHESHEEAEQRQPARVHDLLLEPTGHGYPYLAGRPRNPATTGDLPSVPYP